jgi:thioredoxin reductase
LLTGYRADIDLMCRAGIRLNDREGPMHDPKTFETNVPGLFVAGGAMRASTRARSSSRTARSTGRRSWKRSQRRM